MPANITRWNTLDSGINVWVRLLIFGLFSSGYVLIKGDTLINFSIFYLLNTFFTFFPSAMYKKMKLSVILRGGYAYSRGYVYSFCQMFQGLRLFRSLEYIEGGYYQLFSGITAGIVRMRVLFKGGSYMISKPNDISGIIKKRRC